MVINPLDPRSIRLLFDLFDYNRDKLNTYQRKQREDRLKKKVRPFKAINNARGRIYHTLEGGMNISGFTLASLAKEMEMPYTTLKGHAGKSIPKPTLNVYMYDKQGIKKLVNIYTCQDAKVISEYLYDNYGRRGLTLKDFQKYKETPQHD